MRISDWSSDVCSSDLVVPTCYQSDSPCHPKIGPAAVTKRPQRRDGRAEVGVAKADPAVKPAQRDDDVAMERGSPTATASARQPPAIQAQLLAKDTAADISTRRLYSARSEEHTSELKSLMRISYAVFCLKK